MGPIWFHYINSSPYWNGFYAYATQPSREAETFRAARSIYDGEGS